MSSNIYDITHLLDFEHLNDTCYDDSSDEDYTEDHIETPCLEDDNKDQPDVEQCQNNS